MNVKVWLSALSALLLGACAHHHFKVPDPARPLVVLTKTGRLVVNQEPVVIPLKDGETVSITYRLPPDSGLRFDPTRGVRILGMSKDENYEPIPAERRNKQGVDPRFNDAFVCRPAPSGSGKGDAAIDPQAFVCEFPAKGKIPKGLYAYEINVIGPQGAIRLDPSWMPD